MLKSLSSENLQISLTKVSASSEGRLWSPTTSRGTKQTFAQSQQQFLFFVIGTPNYILKRPTLIYLWKLDWTDFIKFTILIVL